jgi:GxxExxY protein
MSDQTAKIKDIAQDVYKTLGSGFSEDVYDRAMQVGLRLANIGYEGQKVIELKLVEIQRPLQEGKAIQTYTCIWEAKN